MEAPLAIAGNSDLFVETSGAVTISGAIGNDEPSMGGLVVSQETGENGTLVLAGANTYSGGTTVDPDATLTVSNNNALGTGVVTLDSGATLAVTGSSLTLTGDFSQDAGSTTTIATGDSLILNGGASLSGTTSGAGTLVLASGTTTIAGANTYTGGTTADSFATLSISAAGDIGTGALTLLSYSTLDLTAANISIANDIFISGDATIDVTKEWDNLTGTISDETGGIGELDVSGGGGLVLQNDDTYSGGTTVNGAALDIYEGDSLGSGPLTLENDAEFFAGNLTLASGISISISGGSNVSVVTGYTATISGAIGNDGTSMGGLTVGAGGTLVLAGANTYSGGTTVDPNATLSISADENLGASTSALTLQNDATLELSAAFTLSNAISILVIATIEVTAKGEWNNFAGSIGGAGSLNVTGGGGLVLEADDTYSGGTTVNEGALDIYQGDSLGSGPLTLEGKAEFFLAGNLTLASAISISISGISNLSVVTGYAATISGAIGNDGASTGSLVVGGPAANDYGTLVLAGANTYSGGTTVESRATVSTSSISAFGSGGLTNDGTVLVSSGPLELKGAVKGTGTDMISGGATLEFGAGVSTAATLGDQDIGFTGGGTLHLLAPTSFYGEISDFAAGDTVELLGSWHSSGISETAGVTTLTLAKGSTTHAFEFVGDYTQDDFSIIKGKTTTIGYA